MRHQRQSHILNTEAGQDENQPKFTRLGSTIGSELESQTLKEQPVIRLPKKRSTDGVIDMLESGELKSELGSQYMSQGQPKDHLRVKRINEKKSQIFRKMATLKQKRIEAMNVSYHSDDMQPKPNPHIRTTEEYVKQMTSCDPEKEKVLHEMEDKPRMLLTYDDLLLEG